MGTSVSSMMVRFQKPAFRTNNSSFFFFPKLLGGVFYFVREGIPPSLQASNLKAGRCEWQH